MIDDDHGRTAIVDLRDTEFKELLMKTNLLKVGHHGSHNATPRAFVEEILGKGDFTAMVCTRETKKFKKIPLPSLLKPLDHQSGNRLARVMVQRFRISADRDPRCGQWGSRERGIFVRRCQEVIDSSDRPAISACSISRVVATVKTKALT